jgi:hypothetical protein
VTAPACASVQSMPNSDMTRHWAGRLRDLATEEGVPGAALGVWADGQEGWPRTAC